MFLINNNEKISRREHELAEIDGRHKILEPMDYGFELIPGVHDESASPEDIEKLKKESGHFFKNSLVTDFREEGSELSFTSNEKTEINENNTVHGVFFERKGAGKALILLPNWNADGPSFDTLARLYSLANYSCLRLSLPYHDDRKPPDWPIAKYMVSANIGRTISAIRQAVLDVRCSIDWLVSRNYTSIGIVGISIGSCIATLTAAHDSRVNVIVQTLMASNFAEAVWSGIATKHIRQSFDNNISLEQLKKYWAVISPDEYFHFLRKPDKNTDDYRSSRPGFYS